MWMAIWSDNSIAVDMMGQMIDPDDCDRLFAL